MRTYDSKEALTTQRSCLLLGFSVPWLPNLASKTAISAILSCMADKDQQNHSNRCKIITDHVANMYICSFQIDCTLTKRVRANFF